MSVIYQMGDMDDGIYNSMCALTGSATEMEVASKAATRLVRAMAQNASQKWSPGPARLGGLWDPATGCWV